MEDKSTSTQGLESETPLRRLEAKSATAQGLEDETPRRLEDKPTSTQGLENETPRGLVDKRTSTQGMVTDDDCSQELTASNRIVRPKRYQMVKFTVNGETRTGKVTRVGKQSGKDKNRCWIQCGAVLLNFDFAKEIDYWQSIQEKKVHFEDEREPGSASWLESRKKDNDTKGIWFLKNRTFINRDQFENEPNLNEIFTTKTIPQKYHDNPKIIEAKEEEIKKWNEYEAFEWKELNETMNILSSRWVISEKSDGKVKARFVVRGFEEEIYPQSDSPTASNESLKLFWLEMKGSS